MPITYSYTVNEKYREEDHLVTDITIQFAGDITNEVNTVVYHFRPETVEEIEQNIDNRIITERDKILAQQKIEQLINQL
jgi:hypothetical protein